MSIRNNNHLVKDLFSKEQLYDLKDKIYTYYDKTPKVRVDLEEIKSKGYPKDGIMIQDWSGRSTFDATPFLSKDIKKTLEDYVLSYGNDIVWSTCLFVRYSKDFGVPFLGPHLDDHDTNFTIDYQLDSNTNWDIVVEGKTYSLENNHAVVFSPSEQIHWRPPKRFNDTEYVDMLLCYFTTTANSLKLTTEEKRSIAKKYNLEYEQEHQKTMNGEL